ncbi:kinase-like domain-containing protein [Leptodontidium sp. 2 PMI_412]|nr:kinase-like domain-containing protein [Leptodontidium sp. 2 PMI_412]
MSSVLACLNCFGKLLKSKNKNSQKSQDDLLIDGNRGAVGQLEVRKTVFHATECLPTLPQIVEKSIVGGVPASPPATDPPASTTPAAVTEQQQPQPLRTPVPKIQVRQPTIHQGNPTDVVPQSLHATPERSRQNSIASERSRSNSKASSTTGHWLKEQLYEARLECPHRAHCFIVPRSVQEKLITVATVSKDIQARNSEIDDKKATAYAEKACKSSRQLYATLAYIKKGADICALLDEGITDADLPFVRKPDAPRKFALHRNNGEPIKTLETWRDKYLENFDRFQWWMNAPIFRLNEDLYDLDVKTVLPFVPVELRGDELARKQGGYSEVYPVRIHPAHHEFWERSGRPEDEPLVAVKRLFNSDETEFMKEATILNAVGLKHHPHLIKLLATYKHEGKYHLMFPYANANLRKYWDDRPSPEFNRDTVLWSLRQMTGIANGLLRIHTFSVTYPLRATTGAGSIRMPKDVKLMVERGEEWFGRHGDIKPENVLWFENDRENQDPKGVLQIADFGLGRFHGRDSRSGVDPGTVQTSPTYEPPECQLRQPVSRAYDIWSLGCLYLEFLTWLLMGYEQIEGFSEFRGREATGTGINDDNFFTIINDSSGQHAIVRKTVMDWKNRLHTHPKCSELIHDLLDLTMKDLLVTETSDRCKASWLFQQLKMYLDKAEKDDKYLLKAVPHPAKPANDRSNSTSAALGVPTTRAKSNSVTFPEGTKNSPVKRVAPTQLPKDLVQRIAGTPSFKAPTTPLGVHPTWPLGVNKGQMAH